MVAVSALRRPNKPQKKKKKEKKKGREKSKRMRCSWQMGALVSARG